MTGYTEKDAARDTGDTPGEVARAHHQARADARVRTGSPRDRPTQQNQRDARDKAKEILERAKAGEPERPRDRER